MSRLLPYGERALLVEVDDSAAALGLAAALSELAGVDEAVPGARTVLVRSATADGLAELRTAVGAALQQPPRAAAEVDAGLVELPVRYDGADLATVADELGLTVAQLVERHAAASYRVVFCGFAPGFAYLTGLDPTLHLGRLASPRTRVPPGSVGIAGEFTGVYPRSSPGGWRLLGTTDATLWDTERRPPALLTPGTTVRFVPS